jgi:hypothetical protein
MLISFRNMSFMVHFMHANLIDKKWKIKKLSHKKPFIDTGKRQ